VVEIETGQSVQATHALHATIGEWTAQREVVRLGVVARQRIPDFAALPRFEHGKLVEQRDPGVGDADARREMRERALAGEGTDGAVTGSRPSEIESLELMA